MSQYRTQEEESHHRGGLISENGLVDSISKESEDLKLRVDNPRDHEVLERGKERGGRKRGRRREEKKGKREGEKGISTKHTQTLRCRSFDKLFVLHCGFYV